ncbi:hypothetical protein BYT27DRAFT_7263821 [Phlegmacium glaucopus]|nr:hypothetical protein BYT27DRAFT_7263821 [Phlegmacium glaucopus]
MNMDTSTFAKRPTKRRRTKGRLIEDDDEAADGIAVYSVVHQTPNGPVEETMEEPVWIDRAPLPDQPEAEKRLPNPEFNENHAHDCSPPHSPQGTGAPRTQQYYMEEFITRVHPMLKALLSRDALPSNSTCACCMRGNEPYGKASASHRSMDRDILPSCAVMGGWGLLSDPPSYQLNPQNKDDIDDQTEACMEPVGLLNSTECAMDIDNGEANIEGKTFDWENIEPMDPGEYVGEIFDDAVDNGTENEETLGMPEGYMPNEDPPGWDRASTGVQNDSTEGGTAASDDLPRYDALKNPYVRVIHTNGIHHLSLVVCTCRGRETTHCDVMAAGLVPTSFVRYRTVFTHAVLDDFRMSNLESPMTPESVPNLYHELRRISHIWRWLKKLKWAGFAHKSEETTSAKPGELANFCPACPQPGINLPGEWLLDPQRWVYQRSFVADGNFKADHVRQPNAADDIWLSEGGGMMSPRCEYDAFIKTTIERSTKAPCENQFRAIEMSMLLSKACDITGIVAIACARHGCFAPNSVANLFRGEQQKNVDWAFLQALKTTTVHERQGVMIIYDIACQYIIHLQERIGHLLPPV